MSRLFYHTMQDNLGNLLFDVVGTMRLAGTGTLATIYGDPALTVVLPNPMTNHPSFGSFKCYLGEGTYDFYMAKGGYTFETLTGLQGWGTMALQNASSVVITGGTATLSGIQAVNAGFGTVPVAGFNLVTGAGDAFMGGKLGLGVNPPLARIDLTYTKASNPGIAIKPSDSDAGSQPAMQFLNVAGTGVGSITITSGATAYNTTSDTRLKKDVDDLTGELDVIQALRPVRFKWIADESDGVGFLASEVMAHVQGVITGEPDAVDEAGQIVPQQIDHSRLVPYLVGAIKTLQARIAVLEDALGV